MSTWPIFLVAEDDPDDVDFEPDFEDAGKKARNKVGSYF